MWIKLAEYLISYICMYVYIRQLWYYYSNWLIFEFTDKEQFVVMLTQWSLKEYILFYNQKSHLKIKCIFTTGQLQKLFDFGVESKHSNMKHI